MIYCITFDEEGNEVLREEKPKRYVPRKGFSRGPDGNFYKQLGSPACISDKKPTEEFKKPSEETKTNVEVEVKRPNMGTHVLTSPKMSSYKNFKRNIAWAGFIKSTSVHTFKNVWFYQSNFFDIPLLKDMRSFAEVAIDLKLNVVKMWKTKEDLAENPHYVILNPIYFEKEE